jgi:hypothetical protein
MGTSQATAPRRVVKGALSLVVVGLLLGACSSDLGAYNHVQFLAAELDERGLGCEDLVEPDIDPGAGEGVQSSSGTCEVRGESVQLYVFDTEEDADLWFERGRMDTEPTVRGVNWVIVTSRQELADYITGVLERES